MKFLDPALDAYAEANSSQEPAYLKELDDETRASVDMPQMLSGHVQGRILSLMSRLLAPRLVLDIGTFTGYSALCMAEGLAPDGVLHTIDIKGPLAPLVDRYVRKAGFHERIHQHIAPALGVIPRIEGVFDLVFIDADKQNYSAYFDLVIERMRPGGMIIADNVLWSGRVSGARPVDGDRSTAALRAFVERVHADPRFHASVLPLGDGLLIAGYDPAGAGTRGA